MPNYDRARAIGEELAESDAQTDALNATLAAQDALSELRRECGYPDNPDDPASLDNLIDYKDALEDALGALLAQVEEIGRVAKEWGEECAADDTYWERVATGQDSEEAEASGNLGGWTAALDRVCAYLAGDGELLDPGTYSRDKLAALDEEG